MRTALPPEFSEHLKEQLLGITEGPVRVVAVGVDDRADLNGRTLVLKITTNDLDQGNADDFYEVRRRIRTLATSKLTASADDPDTSIEITYTTVDDGSDTSTSTTD